MNIPLPPLRLATAKTLGMQSSYGNIELSLFGNIVLRSCDITRMPQYPNAGMPHCRNDEMREGCVRVMRYCCIFG